MTEPTLVYLKDRRTGELVEATMVYRLSARELQLTEEKDWRPVIQQRLDKLEEEGVAKEQWPQHSGWSWQHKYKKYGRSIAYRFFGIRRDEQLQGLMLISTLFQKGRYIDHEGKPILYVHYIETAPWNLRAFIDEPKYGLVGTNFIDAAITLSIDEECEGRIALHSLPQSDSFYQNCGMLNLGLDANYDNLRYFEMTKEQAQAFISEEDT